MRSGVRVACTLVCTSARARPLALADADAVSAIDSCRCVLQVHPWDPLGALPDAPVFTRQSILALVLVVASAARQMTSGSQSDHLRWPSHIAGKQSALSKAAGLARLLQSLRESSASAELDAELELALRALSRWTQHLLGITEYSEYPSVAEPKNARPARSEAPESPGCGVCSFGGCGRGHHRGVRAGIRQGP